MGNIAPFPRCALCSVFLRPDQEPTHPDDPTVCLDCGPRKGLRDVRPPPLTPSHDSSPFCWPSGQAFH